MSTEKDNFSVNDRGGMKDTYGKLDWTLFPFDAFPGMVKVLMYGAKKYTADNWRKVEKSEYVKAALRHFIAWLNGEVYDPESGLPHLDHFLCDVAFIRALYGEDVFKQVSKIDPGILEQIKTGGAEFEGAVKGYRA